MSFRRILIAIDVDEIGVHATLVGLELAAALGAELALIHVAGPSVSDGAWIAVAAPELVMTPGYEISQVLASLKGRAPIPADAARFEPVGDPAECVVQTARDWRADLVVVGSHGRSGLDRVFLGSVAEWVARRAPCASLIVRKM
jgi:nucleotide-binding universal stress UspA family protein